jgi:hypothetical protein
MTDVSNDEQHHEDVRTNDEPHDTDGASATSWGDLDATTSPHPDERPFDFGKVTEVTLYREDWSDLDTTAEQEAERYDEDVDVTILDERPDSPGPDIDLDRLAHVADECISAEWDASLDCGALTVTGNRSVLDLNFVLVWSHYRDVDDGATYLDGETAGIVLDGRDLLVGNPLAECEPVTSPRELYDELETVLGALRARAVDALRDRATSLLVESRQLDGMGSDEEE